MGCHGSKAAATPTPQQQQEAAKSTLLSPQGKASTDKAFEKVGVFNGIQSEIDKLSVDELRAIFLDMPEDVRNKLARIVGVEADTDPEPTSTIFDGFGGLNAVKAEIDRLTVDELSAYLLNTPEDFRKMLMEMLGMVDNANSSAAAIYADTAEKSEPEEPRIQSELQQTNVQAEPEKPKIVSVPAPGPVQQSGNYFSCYFCQSAEPESEDEPMIELEY